VIWRTASTLLVTGTAIGADVLAAAVVGAAGLAAAVPGTDDFLVVVVTVVVVVVPSAGVVSAVSSSSASLSDAEVPQAAASVDTTSIAVNRRTCCDRPSAEDFDGGATRDERTKDLSENLIGSFL